MWAYWYTGSLFNFDPRRLLIPDLLAQVALVYLIPDRHTSVIYLITDVDITSSQHWSVNRLISLKQSQQVIVDKTFKLASVNAGAKRYYR